MNVFVSDLDKHASSLREQVMGDNQSISQIAEIRVDPLLPGVPERTDLLGLAGWVGMAAVPDITFTGADLPVGSELDAVGRIYVDHLDLAAQVFLLGEAGHHLEGVAEDEAVRPVDTVVVEIDELFKLEAVEVAEQRQLV